MFLKVCPRWTKPSADIKTSSKLSSPEKCHISIQLSRFCNINDAACKGLPQVNQTQWWFQSTLLGAGQPKSFQKYVENNTNYLILHE